MTPLSKIVNDAVDVLTNPKLEAAKMAISKGGEFGGKALVTASTPSVASVNIKHAEKLVKDRLVIKSGNNELLLQVASAAQHLLLLLYQLPVVKNGNGISGLNKDGKPKGNRAKVDPEEVPLAYFAPQAASAVRQANQSLDAQMASLKNIRPVFEQVLPDMASVAIAARFIDLKGLVDYLGTSTGVFREKQLLEVTTKICSQGVNVIDRALDWGGKKDAVLNRFEDAHRAAGRL